MSASELTVPNNSSLYCINLTASNDVTVGGNIDVDGTITVAGSFSVAGPDPSISIINNATNSNRSTLLLQGAAALSSTPFKVQQDGAGNGVIENFSSGSNIDVNLHGSGFLSLNGTSYPVGPSLLTLDASNNVVPGGPIKYANFIPTLTFSTTTDLINYTNQLGEYSIINNIVFFSITIGTNGIGSSTGNVFVQGLPVNSVITSISSISCNIFSGLTLASGSSLGAEVFSGENQVRLYAPKIDGTNPVPPLTAGAFTGPNVNILMSGFYFTA